MQVNPLEELTRLIKEIISIDDAEIAMMEIIDDIIVDREIPGNVQLSPLFTVGDLQKTHGFWTSNLVVEHIAGAFLGRATALLLTEFDIDPGTLPLDVLFTLIHSTVDLQRELASRTVVTAIAKYGEVANTSDVKQFEDRITVLNKVLFAESSSSMVH
jgi:hypothetical protein